MRKALVPVFFLLALSSIQAESIEWHSGIVVLRSKEIVKGKLSINQAFNLLLVQQDEGVEVYPAHKIRTVYFYDENGNPERKFVSVQQTENSVTTYHLFELLVGGQVNVLRKLLSKFSDERDNSSYKYFVRWNEELFPIARFRSKLYKKLIAQSELLTSFISENKLSADFPPDVIKIIKFYNSEHPVGESDQWAVR